MTPRRQYRSDDDPRSGNLADNIRNERKKSVLLYEVERMDRRRSSELIQHCEELIAESKVLCKQTRTLLNESRNLRQR